jgi:acyl-CoA reductase-like NAD-dependent aldehyde dehydrogenase
MPDQVLAEGTSESLERIKIAVIEGTARSIRHQQQQLNKLYNGLLKARSELQGALQQEHSLTESEALFEHSLTLQEIGAHYNGTSLSRKNSKATKIERGEDNPDYACPYGIVYIVPSSGLYSVLSALVAALVAGNCVVLEVGIIEGSLKNGSC